MDHRKLTEVVEQHYERAGRPGRVMLGLSGGADSVALLCLLDECREKWGFDLRSVHIHHGLRKVSDDEEVFVRNLCEQRKVPIEVVRVEIAAGGNLEARARELRYREFMQAAAQNQSDLLALAHHMEDQAETVLLRLMHGTGAQGLSGMRIRSGIVWRPLLGVHKDDLLNYLKSIGQDYCEDMSNLDTHYRRNAVRHRILSVMQEYAPATVENLARTADILAAEEDDWNDRCGSWLKTHASGQPAAFLMADDAAELSVAMQRRILRVFLQANGIVCDFAQIERARALINTQGRQTANLSGGARVMRIGSRLHLLTDDPARIRLGTVLYSSTPPVRGRCTQQFDATAVEGAELRYPDSADRISPLGVPGSDKLSDYLINRKVDQPLRKHWPILAKGRTILWVPGVGMASTAAVHSDSSDVVWAVYHGRLPDEINWTQR